MTIVFFSDYRTIIGRFFYFLIGKIFIIDVIKKISKLLKIQRR